MFSKIFNKKDKTKEDKRNKKELDKIRKKALEYKTFIIQEMLSKGYLASTSFYASVEHKESDLALYFDLPDKSQYGNFFPS